MTKKSPEYLSNYLRVLSEVLSYAEASRVMGADQSLVYRHIAESKAASANPDEPSVFLLEYEGETKWFHEFVRGVVTQSIEAIEAAARSRALYGTFTTAKFQGKTVYRDDPDLIGLDDEMLDFLGYKDRLLRDENGRPVPEMIWTPPSTDLVAMILQAHSKKYRKQSSITMDVNNRISGGVMIVGGNKPAPQTISAPLPVLEIIEAAEPEPALTDEPVPADDADEATEIDEEFTPSTPEPVAPEERVISEAPPPAEYTPPPQTGPLAPTNVERSGRSLTPLELDLLRRVRGPVEQRSAPISSKTYISAPDNIGPGRVPDGGKRVV